MQEILIDNWNHLRPYVKQWWDKLTDQDLDNIDGKYDVLVRLLQKKHGLSAQQAKDQVLQRLAQFDRRHQVTVER